MSSEPERPIEKLLRTRARQRREQAGKDWEIHPATRRLLQQEVSQRFGRKIEPAASWFNRLLSQGWFKPAAALGGVAVAVAITWAVLQAPPADKTSPELLAKNESRQAAGTASSAVSSAFDAKKQSAPDRPTEASGRLLKEEIAKDGRVPFDDKRLWAAETAKQVAASGGPPAAAPALIPPQGSTSDREATPSIVVNGPELRSESSLTVAQPASPQILSALDQAKTKSSPTVVVQNLATAAPANQVVLSGATTEAGSRIQPAAAFGQANFALASAPASVLPTVLGYFAQSQAPAGNNRSLQLLRNGNEAARKASKAEVSEQPNNQILPSFRMEQAGPELRLIDKDGSVYSGPVQGFTSLQLQTGVSGGPIESQARSGTAGLGLKSTQLPSTQFVFQVIGTNRTSNQRVVFSGKLIADTNLIARILSTRDQPVDSLGRADTQRGIPQNPPATGMRVSGTALIGQDQQLQIDAVPIAPPPRE